MVSSNTETAGSTTYEGEPVLFIFHAEKNLPPDSTARMESVLRALVAGYAERESCVALG